eukprot:5153067-Prymnesium_polylepis.1
MDMTRFSGRGTRFMSVGVRTGVQSTNLPTTCRAQIQPFEVWRQHAARLGWRKRVGASVLAQACWRQE